VNSILWFLVFLNLALSVYLLFLHYHRFIRPLSTSKLSTDTPCPPVKIQVLKFNPFPGVGGEQSFILCLLDQSNTGVIITSLHTPSHTRTYAKPVIEGKADGVSLSREEATFLKKVINS
jgi:hypothetical protein